MKIDVAVIKHLLKTRNIDFLNVRNNIVIRLEDKDKVLQLVKEVTERSKSTFVVVETYILEGVIIICL